MRNTKYRRHFRHPGRGLWNGCMLLCIGCILIATGLSLGGKWTIENWLPRGWHWNLEGRSGGRTHENSHAGGALIHVMPESSGALPADLKSIDITLKFASLVIHRGAKASYRTTDFGSDSIAIRKEGTGLVFDEKTIGNRLGDGHGFLHPSVDIVLPEGIKLDRCTISVGAGNVSIDGLDTDRLEIMNAAGKINGKKVAARDADLKIGAGSLELTGAILNHADIQTAAGHVVFSGDITEGAQISTGAGSVELNIEKPESMYRIDYQRGLGSIKIGQESFSGIGSGSYGNHDAKRHIELQTGIGSVRILFGK